VSGTLMSRQGFRHAGISGLAVMWLVHAASAAPGGGPQGGGQGFGGAPGGGYGSGFSGPARGPGAPQDHPDGYDFSGPNFNFSVRKTRHPQDDKNSAEPQDSQAQGSKTPPPAPVDNDLWQRFRNGFGLFGSSN
jgi:hypothetical protein